MSRHAPPPPAIPESSQISAHFASTHFRWQLTTGGPTHAGDEAVFHGIAQQKMRATAIGILGPGGPRSEAVAAARREVEIAVIHQVPRLLHQSARPGAQVAVGLQTLLRHHIGAVHLERDLRHFLLRRQPLHRLQQFSAPRPPPRRDVVPTTAAWASRRRARKGPGFRSRWCCASTPSPVSNPLPGVRMNCTTAPGVFSLSTGLPSASRSPGRETRLGGRHARRRRNAQPVAELRLKPPSARVPTHRQCAMQNQDLLLNEGAKGVRSARMIGVEGAS